MLTVTPIPAFNDNYLWLIENRHECWIVDPGDAKPVKAALAAKGRALTGILVTHHHSDHIGGIEQLIEPGMPVIGPSANPFYLVNDPVSEGDIRRVCGIDFRVIGVPGHTLNHLAYYAEPDASGNRPPALFCGDTLFAGGCGRLFEGTAAQMHDSLDKLSRLRPETLVYCAHEYTLANLAFAISLEPENRALKQRIEDVKNLRSKNIPTIPSTIKAEKETNPFLRVSSPEIIQRSLEFDPETSDESTSIFGTIRRMKDVF